MKHILPILLLPVAALASSKMYVSSAKGEATISRNGGPIFTTTPKQPRGQP